MHLTATLEGLTEAELLDHADEVARTQRECEAQMLRIAVQLAILNNPDTPRPRGEPSSPGASRRSVRRGRARPTSRSSHRSRSVRGWASRPASAHSLMADALDLMIRLPQLWRRVRGARGQGVLRPLRRAPDARPQRRAGVVRRRARRRVRRRPDPVDPFRGPRRPGVVAASDPAAAAQKERDDAERQVAKPTRSTEAGMRGFFIRAPFPVIARLDARVAVVRRHPRRASATPTTATRGGSRRSRSWPTRTQPSR